MAALDDLIMMGPPEVDKGSMSLIISLQRDDIRQYFASNNGQHAEGERSDTDLAMGLYARELDRFNRFNPIAPDRTPDRHPALQTEEDDQDDQDDAQYDSDIESEYGHGYILRVSEYGDEYYETIYSTSDDNTSEGSDGNTDGMRGCLACNEIEVNDLAQVPCRHKYCSDCLAQLFRNATADEALFPPRCCRRQIPLEPNEHLLPEDLVRHFRDKEVEFSTPNRTYCHQATCSAFIHPAMHVGLVATCSACQSTTCIACKGPSHNGDCPPNDDLQGVVRLAQEEGWQRCPNCQSMIELSTGCYHIT